MREKVSKQGREEKKLEKLHFLKKIKNAQSKDNPTNMHQEEKIIRNHQCKEETTEGL